MIFWDFWVLRCWVLGYVLESLCFGLDFGLFYLGGLCMIFLFGGCGLL